MTTVKEAPVVTLLDLYNFHLASAPQSPVSASFLATLGGASGATGLGPGLGLGAGTLAASPLGSHAQRMRAMGSVRAGSQLGNSPLSIGGAGGSVRRGPVAYNTNTNTNTNASTLSATPSSAFSLPKKSNFLCCGTTFKTFPELAKHYDAVHSSGPGAGSQSSENQSLPIKQETGIAIPAKPVAEEDAHSLVSLSDLLSLPDRQPTFLEQLNSDLPKDHNTNQQPLINQRSQISDALCKSEAPVRSNVGKGKSQLSLGLSAASLSAVSLQGNNGLTSRDCSSSVSPPPSTNNAVYRANATPDAMFSSAEDMDATLSLLLANQPSEPAPQPQTPLDIGKAFASKRTLSSAAFSLGSYTEADLKKLRTDLNFTGIDLGWLTGDRAAGNAAGAIPVFGSPVSEGAEAFDRMQQQQQSGFQSIGIPASIEQLAQPIPLESLTPENYLLKLLEAHHLVGQAQTFLGGGFGNGAQDFFGAQNVDVGVIGGSQENALMQEGWLSGAASATAQVIKPSQLSHAQLSQLISGMTNIDVNGNPQGLGLQLDRSNASTPLSSNSGDSRGPSQEPILRAGTADPLLGLGLTVGVGQAPTLAGGAKLLACPHCGKNYKSHSGYRYHLDHVHPELAGTRPATGPTSAPVQQTYPQSVFNPLPVPMQQLPTIGAPDVPMSNNFFQKQNPVPVFGNMQAPTSGLAAVVAPLTTAPTEAHPLLGSDGLPRRQIHPSQLNKPFKCTVAGCLKSYKNKGGLKYHLEHEHPGV
ncbi:hypothetical protein BC830DRAFT_1164768 [Chytriomyces sp. MP71]|nr:hypothetical protein BC830DRAFT_1164768 [Chytriomyces sp. MP71]